MRKTIIATTLIPLGLSATFSQSAFATTNEQSIDDSILVTANRSQQDQFLALSAHTVITANDIKTMQVSNVSEVLDTVAGISVVTQGSTGQISSVFMRGTNSNHTLILIDGVRANSATSGAANLTAISPSQIDRIEIVKGPRAALWGSDAIGGVIQIFTKKLQSGDASITLGVGSHNLTEAAVSVGLGNEKHNLTISIAADQADGFDVYQPDPIIAPDEDGYERTSVSLNGLTTINDSLSMNLIARFEEGNSEYDDIYNSGSFDEVDHENYSVKVAAVYQGEQVFSELSVATSQDEGKNFGEGLAASVITTERDQISLVNEFSINAQGSIALGADYYVEKVSGSDLDSWTPGEQAWDETERSVSAVFLQSRQQINNLLLEGAVRYDDIENLDTETTYNVSVGYQVAPDWLVSVAHGTGFKAPSFNDLYWPNYGNPELEPEEITNNEILIRHQFDSDSIDASFEISAYDSEIENLIAWAPTAENPAIWLPANVNMAEIKGIEATTVVNFNDFSHQLNLAFVDSEDTKTGKQLLRRPELTASYSLSYYWQKFSFSSLVSYHDDSLDSKDYADYTLESYVLVDIGVSYEASRHFTVNAKVNNIFDEEYETASNYATDGTNFKASVTYNF